jgi:hypothetical protein
MITEINAIRPKLRAWAATQPDAIRIRAGFIDKNLRQIAKSPSEASGVFAKLVENHDALIGMISANRTLTSEERN